MSEEPERDPTERELVDYVRYRLESIGPRFAEPQLVGEAIMFNRDLRVALYKIDDRAATG